VRHGSSRAGLPFLYSDENAMLVLRRPGAAEISEADAYIFGLVRQASAGRKTAPWTFHLVGPHGIGEITGQPDSRQRYDRQPTANLRARCTMARIFPANSSSQVYLLPCC
jgi:hypothetical protein